jgi:hypothetical protein
MLNQKHEKPKRCGRCHSCSHALASLKAVLAQASPPFSDTSRIIKRWSEVMDRYPCVSLSGR